MGASCFLIAPFPGFVELVGSAVDGAVFFVGSIFFTSAAALQCLETFNADREPGDRGARWRFRVLAFEPRRIDWWSSVVQFAGTLFFNVDTFRAMQTGIEQTSYTGSSGHPTPSARPSSSSPATLRTWRSAVVSPVDRAVASSGE